MVRTKMLVHLTRMANQSNPRKRNRARRKKADMERTLKEASLKPLMSKTSTVRIRPKST